MNQMEIFKNPEFGSIRTFEQDGKVLFCGTDVATALGYANPRKAVRDHTRCGTKCSIGVQTGKKADGTPAVQMVEMLFTVIVAPITSKPDVKAKLPTHCRLDLKNCLNEPSVVLLEQLRTLDKRRLKKYIGKLKKSSMNEVNRALAVSVGLSKFYLCQKECAEHLNQIAENNTRQ